MHSIWSDTVNLPTFEALCRDIKTDVLIIGGGIAGVLSAFMLEEAGVDYVLVEADRILSGITKNTTAKLTVQHSMCRSCPCHGSRFTEKGEVIDNPATGDIRNKD